jgi:hypothetical protein
MNTSSNFLLTILRARVLSCASSSRIFAVSNLLEPVEVPKSLLLSQLLVYGMSSEPQGSY